MIYFLASPDSYRDQSLEAQGNPNIAIYLGDKLASNPTGFKNLSGLEYASLSSFLPRFASPVRYRSSLVPRNDKNDDYD